MPAQEFLISLCRLMPALVLHKTVIAAKIRGHPFSVIRTYRHKIGRNRHLDFCIFRDDQLSILSDLISFRQDHPADDLVVIVGLVLRRLARGTALKQAIVALRIKKPLLIESTSLEAMINIGRQDKIIFVPDQCKQPLIEI